MSVVIVLASGRLMRLSTLSPGMTFAELAKTRPTLELQLLENLLHNVSQMLVRLNRQVIVLAE